MAYLTITDVESYMVDSAASGVEYKVARTHLARCDRLSASGLCTGVMRQRNTKLRHDGHRESGAVCSVCQARSAVYIAVSDELYRIVRDLRTLGGNASGLRTGRSVICTALLSAALGAGTALSGAVLRIALTVRGIRDFNNRCVLDRLFKTILNIHVVTGQVCILIIDLDLDPAVLLIRDKESLTVGDLCVDLRVRILNIKKI